MGSAVLFKTADDRVLGSAFLDVSGARKAGRRPWWVRDFLCWLLRQLKALGFLTWMVPTVGPG